MDRRLAALIMTAQPTPTDLEAPAQATGRCGVPRRSDGKPCTQWPVRGTKRCKMHGGLTPQVKQAGVVRVLEAQVKGQLRQQGWEPVTDPIRHYAELGGEVLAFKDLCRARINELEGRWEVPAEGFVAEDTKAAVQLYERALDRADKILASMLRIGLDAEALRQSRERPSREQAETLAAILAQVLADPRVSVQPGQANAVVIDALKGLGT
jgi:hypothetical protein